MRTLTIWNARAEHGQLKCECSAVGELVTGRVWGGDLGSHSALTNYVECFPLRRIAAAFSVNPQAAIDEQAQTLLDRVAKEPLAYAGQYHLD